LPQFRADRARQRREEILDAALQVFSSKGFHRATNQDIARAAGIGSAGLIYHYFQDKQDLLKHLLERLNPALDELVSSEFQNQPLRAGLISLAEGFASLAGDPKRAATVRLFLSEALLEQETASALYAAGPQRFLSALTPWLQKHIDRGELKAWPADQLARHFLSPFFLATMFGVVFQQPVNLSAEELQRSVDLFLQGATP
jgi:AcrR family transcriptional regulator